MLSKELAVWRAPSTCRGSFTCQALLSTPLVVDQWVGNIPALISKLNNAFDKKLDVSIASPRVGIKILKIDTTECWILPD